MKKKITKISRRKFEIYFEKSIQSQISFKKNSFQFHLKAKEKIQEHGEYVFLYYEEGNVYIVATMYNVSCRMLYACNI